MALNDIYEVTYFATFGDQAAVIRHNYQERNTAGTGPTTTQFGAVLAANVGAPLKACLSASASYRGLMVKKLTPIPPTQPVINITNQGAGGVVGEPLPRQVRGIITFTTPFAGRGFRGRVYVPFPSEASNDTDATPTAAYVTLLTTLGQAMQQSYPGVGAGGNTGDLFRVLVRYVYIGGNLTSVAYRADITASLPRDRWATQRRSGAYGRPNISPI